jgi:hypothetical protein
VKRRCCYCGESQGEKEPLEDTSTTDGICKKCFESELFKLIKEPVPLESVYIER